MKTDDPDKATKAEADGTIDLPPGYQMMKIPVPVVAIIKVVYDNGVAQEKHFYKADGLRVEVLPLIDEARDVSTESNDSRLSLDEQPTAEQ